MQQQSSHDLSRRSAITGLYVLLVLALVFKTRFSVGSLESVSQFASINSEDFAILLLGLVVTGQQLADRDRGMRLSMPRFTWLFVGLCVWILISTSVAMVRFDVPVTASWLWTLKTFEVLVFLVLIQQHVDRSLGSTVLRTMLVSGSLLGALTVTLAALGRDRPEIFFDNPNGLSSFLMLVLFLSLSKLVVEGEIRVRGLYLTSAALAALGIFATVSRAAVFGTLVGFLVLSFIHREYIVDNLAGILVASAAIFLVVLPRVIGSGGIRRLVAWIQIENGQLRLAENNAAYSFQTRIDLLSRSVELFSQYPFIGWGWFASPSRVTFLDVYYPTIPVELGIVGLFIMTAFHAVILERFWRAKSRGLLAVGGGAFAWQCAVIAQGVGGAFPRVPHHLLITTLVLVSVWEMSKETA